MKITCYKLTSTTRKSLPRWQALSGTVVSAFDGADTDRKIIHNYPISVNHNQKLMYRSRFAVRTRSFCAEIAKSIIKSLALLTTCNQPYETQCILRAIDSIKELFLGYPEGDKRVSVPVQDIGCEVGLHRRKWGDCGLNK